MEITKIKGINEKREKDFNKAGVYNTEDLAAYFPRAYVDLREKQPLKYAYNNDVILTTGKIISVPSTRFFGRRGGGMVKVVCEQEGLFFSVVWFNQPYIAGRLKVGEEYLFYGRVSDKSGGITVLNPSFELCEKSYRLKGIVPQYPLKGSLTQKIVRDSARLAVDIEKPESVIPQEYLKKYGLKDLYYSYRQVHNPENFSVLKECANRIAVEEYYKLISAFKFIKGSREQVRINKYDCPSAALAEFIITRFPFKFTDGQKTAVNEIYSDMTGGSVMNRLMQGDVGSGKTAVSLCAVFIAVKSGYQAVILSPTEVLAEQNYAAAKRAFPDYNVDILTGSMSAKDKRDIKDALKKGYINILVGTHAVISKDVEFKKLSLCVCDEQQRFGVAQRSALAGKGITPDMLVMSATPIPRTLSLILYGDLDITTIKDKPENRKPVQTNIVPTEKYNDMLEFIRRETEVGRCAYFVCPKIEGDEEGTVMSVNELYEELKEKMRGVPVGLLHGKMKDDEKSAVMNDFKNKKIKVLVSTTVVEVGVDVPDATVMVIVNAERFGLSALHQLRGRVGRSDIKSYCFLLSSAKTDNAIERLKVLVENNDGFKISEYDYKMRGGGDFMGENQSGKYISDLGYLNYDTEAIFLAKKISDEFFVSGKDVSALKEIAIKKYDKLKDITMS